MHSNFRLRQHGQGEFLKTTQSKSFVVSAHTYNRNNRDRMRALIHRNIRHRMRAPISCQSKNCRHKMADL